MIATPIFTSLREYRSRIGDLDYWWPYLAEILKRHDLAGAGDEPVAGVNPTFPTFLYGEVVVKLYGHLPAWRTTHAAERGASALVAADPRIAAPRLLAEERLSDEDSARGRTSSCPGCRVWRHVTWICRSTSGGRSPRMSGGRYDGFTCCRHRVSWRTRTGPMWTSRTAPREAPCPLTSPRRLRTTWRARPA